MSHKITPNAEPGTDEQFYVEAVADPSSDPNFDVANSGSDEHERARRFRVGDRTWICGAEYWDDSLSDLCELVAVVRKSSWCSTKDASESPVHLVFESTHGQITYNIERAIEYDAERDPDDRFRKRRRVDDPMGRLR